MSAATEPQRGSLNVTAIPLRGVHLIEASAGTGKTYTITSLVLRFLLEEQRPIESILAVTFTNAATAELKERIVSRVEDARLVAFGLKEPAGDPVLEHVAGLPQRKKVQRLLTRAAQNSDRAGVFTIHGFAARMLADHAFESGAREGAVLVGDQRSLVQDVVADFWTSKVATLSAKEFRLIGGTAFFRILTRVGLAAAGAFEVPLVEVEPAADIKAAEEALSLAYSDARAGFAKEGQELRQLLLTAPSLNRNKMRVASLENDFAAYVHYFSGGDPMAVHPDTERWTQSKVNASTKAKLPPPEHPLLEKLECLRDAAEHIAHAASQMADELRRELCVLVHEAVQAEHVRAGTQSFDGLLSDLLQALRQPEVGASLAREIRALLPVAMIDEFQDTDPVQYEIFQRIYAPSDDEVEARTALYLIGDPKQSIYAFRGADIFTYVQASKRAHG